MEGSLQWWGTGLESRAVRKGEGSTPLPSSVALAQWQRHYVEDVASESSNLSCDTLLVVISSHLWTTNAQRLRQWQPGRLAPLAQRQEAKASNTLQCGFESHGGHWRVVATET
jgi:hypothetical protein